MGQINEQKGSKKATLRTQGGGSDSGDGWLISYADMMTLIACFFILMMAFANYDPQTFARKSKELAKHFNSQKKFLSMGKLEEIEEVIKNHPKLQKTTEVIMANESVIITFRGSTLFDSGEAIIKNHMEESLDAMIDIIKEKNPNFRILVEGHTDNEPLKISHIYHSNWELSGARAARIVERFEKAGFRPDSLVGIGYGQTKPLAPNKDKRGISIEENKQLNRRVVIKILEPLENIKRKKLGLGVFFKNED